MCVCFPTHFNDSLLSSEQFSSLIQLLRAFLIWSTLFNLTASSTQCWIIVLNHAFLISLFLKTPGSPSLSTGITFAIHLCLVHSLQHDMVITSFKKPSSTAPVYVKHFSSVSCACPLGNLHCQVINPTHNSLSCRKLRPRISDLKVQEYGILFWVLYLKK